MELLKKLFGFDSSKHNIRTEIVAGITTFLTMSYILAVNPSMFGLLEGMPAGAVFTTTALGDITSGTALLALIGLVITGVLYALNVKGAMLIRILATTVIGIPMGITEFKGIVSTPESIEPIFCKFEWHNIFTLDMLVIVFTFLFIDLFDTVGTLVGVSTKAKMVDENGRIPNLKQASMADAIATTAGAMLGTSTTTTYVESAAGVAQGGRTGLTAFSIACCFAIALFFSPLFLSVLGAATAPVLILVGMLMMEPVRNIDFDDATEAIPSFITLAMMPLAYSISAGIMLGMISYVIINMCCGKFKKLTPAMYILAVLFILKYIFI